MELSDMKGIGPAREGALRAMGINSLRDLLFTLPVRYEDYSTVFPCNSQREGMVLVSGIISEKPKLSVYHGLRKVTATIADESGKLSVCWYNMPWILNTIPTGITVRLFGRLYIKHNRRMLLNPRMLTKEDTGFCPVYRQAKAFPSKSFRRLVQAALEAVDDCCPETLPLPFRLKYQLCELNFAVRQAHFPQDAECLKAARRRLSFEKILLYLLYASISGSRKQPSHALEFPQECPDTFWASLSFQPTSAQRRVLDEIASDLRKDKAMSRLVQGDVGCGKTAVAFGAVFLAVRSGYQVSMMVPTEILAVQHYENAQRLLASSGIRCRLLTGSTRTKERKQILQDLKDHKCDFLIGTHALISHDVEYGKLGLVITDEQHRFGVNQRSNLQRKGKVFETFPHVLVMSATPIPRTLALILYGDLDISVIDELPAGRIPVKTRLVPEQKRAALYSFLRKEAATGKQVYIVCPLVEDSENLGEIRSAKSLFEELKRNELSGLRLALTWGEQKTEEKERILQEFCAGRIDVLVSTTVIEVGVNNPNATIMVIENADRFGLSQLHQLRGRVGRSTLESWCFLFAEKPDRINILCSTNDGFLISQKDLEQRGPGDLLGTRQAGEPDNEFLISDVRLLDEAAECVRELHRDASLNETLRILEQYAVAYFSEKGREVALN